ncbi:hypothetical protein [Leptotrichia hofstadii]|mgnify:CR=1 FL=1|jgi:hypothetical protein|uniref:Uncharacterized protein n=1 Tax=Leptotrichia hofstadii F0254 TaxID=634994 RepID=C9N014_9FUSO|nr:hypothetical protein [Leptotrichia hofstadii]EEX73501.1 hypothetical protein GCWU000323_02170 [Leptotrichia hofstadii F0254]
MIKIRKEKIIYLYFLFSIIVSFSLFLIFYNTIQYTVKINEKNYTIKNLISTNLEYPYYIDYSAIKNNKFYINGWLVKRGTDNIVINRSIVIKDGKGDYYKIFTKSYINENVSTYFNNEFDYYRTGLVGKGKLNKKMKPPFTIYFLIEEQNSNILINTQKIIERN